MEKNELGCGETWVRPKDSLQTNYMSDKKKNIHYSFGLRGGSIHPRNKNTARDSNENVRQNIFCMACKAVISHYLHVCLRRNIKAKKSHWTDLQTGRGYQIICLACPHFMHVYGCVTLKFHIVYRLDFTQSCTKLFNPNP
jgi:hypothetical protein